MKKSIFLIGLSALVLTSCDPVNPTGTFDVDQVSADQLMKDATFAQYNAVTGADGAVVYEPAADGNWIEFNFPNVNSVTIFYIKGDGSEATLSYGKNAGMFYYVPLRGSDPVQTLYFRYVNADNKETLTSKEFTLQVAQELSAEAKILCSNSGKKKWTWLPTTVNDGAVWGNAGYQAGAQAGDGSINGAWWGCGVIDGECPNTFADQMSHASDDKYAAEGYSTSFMTFNEDGSLVAYDNNGSVFNEGTWKIEGYNGGAPIDDNQNVAYLETSEGAILWPFMINSAEHYMPTRFEVAYLSLDQMILIYAPEGTGGWSECTWWSFGSNDDVEGFLTTDKWTWKPTIVNDGAVWGNAGYLAGDQTGDGSINGAWWGCGVIDGNCPNTFADQMSHASDEKYAAEGYSTSYMTFSEDGTLTAYANDGSVFNEGKWEIDMTPNPEHFAAGTLKTSEGAILWPFMINSAEHYMPTAFEVGYLSNKTMILIYAPEGTGGWSECTWWSFGKE